nr:MAG TPA: Protein of unknown function (DUF2873) [Caudoviricetes sp.]
MSDFYFCFIRILSVLILYLLFSLKNIYLFSL